MDIDWIRVVFTIAILFHSLSRFIMHRKAKSWSELTAAIGEGSIRKSLHNFGTYTAPFYATCVAWVVFPAWFDWASIPLPEAVRWLGIAGIGLCEIGLVWVAAALGSNFSGAVRLKADHKLVQDGPYSWVRHPMYSITDILVLSLGLASANWFLLLVGLTTYCSVVMARIKPEEQMMIEHFGQEYIDYQSNVGALLPRLKTLKKFVARE